MAIKNTARFISNSPLLSTWARQIASKVWEATDKFPWLSTRVVSNILNSTKDIDDEEERKATINELYRAALPIAQNNDKLDERDEILNRKAYEISQMQSGDQKNMQITALKLGDLSNKIKRTYSDQISADADDNEVLNQFIAQIPNWQKMLEDYLNNWDKELLYAGWLATKNIENPWTTDTTQWWIYGVINDETRNRWKGEWINPVWQITTKMDDWANKIASKIDIRWEKPMERLAERINNLSEEELQQMKEDYDNLWKAKKSMYKDFQDYVVASQTTIIDALLWIDEEIQWDNTPSVWKFFGNIPASALTTISATIRWMTNPLDTAVWIAKLIWTEDGRQALKDRYGSWEAFANTMETDPVWTADDALSIAQMAWWLLKGAWKITGWKWLENAWTYVKSNVWSATDAISEKAVWWIYNAIDNKLINSENKIASNVWKYLEYTSNSSKLTQDVKNSIKNKAWQWSENILQNQNRMTKKQQETFKQMAWEDQWKWMNDRWITDTEQLVDYFVSSKDKVDTAMWKIKWRFTSDILTKVLEDCVDYASKTENKDLWKLQDLQSKNSNGWLTMSEINDVKRFYERNNKFNYLKEWTAEKSSLVTNRDTELREWQMKTAEENGLTNLKELNKETQASKYLADHATSWESWIKGNNPISLTDWIVVAQEWITNKTLWNLVGKKIFQSSWFQKWLNKLLNAIAWHETIPEKVADLELIQQINNQKDFDAILKAIEDQENMKALWYNPNANDMWGGTIDTRPITTTPEWQSVRQWQIAEVNNTVKNVGNTNNNMANRLDTKKIAQDYIKWDMDWNKYQHMAWLTEEQAIKKRWDFVQAVENERDKNIDYYNNHQSELVEKFNHLLKPEVNNTINENIPQQ